MKYSQESLIKKAQELGFQSIGVSQCEELSDEARKLERWLNANNHGEMRYMEKYFDLRINPAKLHPGTRSVIVLSFNYSYEPPIQSDVKIARYAYGEDYHLVLRQKVKSLEDWMRLQYGDISLRACIDSAPIMERIWAQKSGLGWNGKNTLNISPKNGSYYFLVCLLTDLEFEYNQPIRDHCGTCTRCIDACPTEAIHEDGYILDASKCISYLTIELKNNIPEEFKPKMHDWVFGCDICQEVCPWNRFAENHKEVEFMPNKKILDLSSMDWINLSDEEWKLISKRSPLKRTGKSGMQRNVRFVMNNSFNNEQNKH